ncbi:FAD-dependent oxidoreductase [Dermatophilus congolensis]|uniref:FAD-dependent oxidoreductase n=1 Tax=Dermatophilus congolensis TaxID=1863 RepID=UPI001AAFBC72|nr:FAD-dependent monooxygenase [Dermatophilus congolensis]MBO3143133.1 NAD(P)-binding protein [Dermatophilus congolensis]MBO3152119.1 NAD(P)-binding protein [Dermatophilus congolensis]MBO3160868.1 NAD(P)-binding protein [Dermatophilus congolensis]MBO3163407.1 NAD(P)-binding protein [Dermatophilus congolensis]MBO3176957.1 NAD(P)-binding protein [Dermatophilus congolensis]
MSSRCVVVGGGPVGLATALLLAQAGHAVTVYEGEEEFPLSDANSYPIGVNPRGQETLRRISPALLERVQRGSKVVAGWHVFAGRRQVAQLRSGRVLSTTRAFVNRVLLEQARACAGIEVVTGHRLVGVDVVSRRLSFSTISGVVEVDAAQARVFAADGVRSVAREALSEQVEGFSPRVEPWGVRFRVLFSQVGAQAAGVDPSFHYVFGAKGVYAAALSTGVWCVSLTCVEGSPDERLLMAEEASAENVAALRRFVAEHAPQVAPLLVEQDYVDFFSRRSFSGAVVRCSRVHEGEWLVLLGDAAHGVIPPTGEGINAGLEDALKVTEVLGRGSVEAFAQYNAARVPDLEALGVYASVLAENVRSSDPVARVSGVVMRVLGQVQSVCGFRGSQVEQRLFGPRAGVAPYREVIGPWIAHRERYYPRVYRLVEWLHRVLRREARG